MNLDDECRLSYYKQIATLNESHGVVLVQHTETNRVYVRKTLVEYDIAVFRHLKDHHIRHTPQIYELIEDGDALIVIEEYISGISLQEILDRDGHVSENMAVSIITQLCTILDGFHSCIPPIIHRDIKPSNIILSADGEVYLLDMDAAKRFNKEASRDTKLIGTEGYAAPEQYGFGRSSIQTDIYSLGILFRVLLTGDIQGDMPIARKYAVIIERCTDLNADRRYRNTLALSEALSVPQDSRTEHTAIRRSWKRYLPPGFRTGAPMKMVLAIIGYVFLFSLGATLQVDHTEKLSEIWLNRIAFLCAGLFIILLSCNYLDIWRKLRITDIQNRVLQVLLIVLLDILIPVVIVFLLVMITPLLP